MDLALNNEKSLVKEQDQNKNENMKQLVTGHSSMNIGQESLQEELRKLRIEKEVERKEFEKLILNTN